MKKDREASREAIQSIFNGFAGSQPLRADKDSSGIPARNHGGRAVRGDSIFLVDDADSGKGRIWQTRGIATLRDGLGGIVAAPGGTFYAAQK